MGWIAKTQKSVLLVVGRVGCGRLFDWPTIVPVPRTGSNRYAIFGSVALSRASDEERFGAARVSPPIRPPVVHRCRHSRRLSIQDVPSDV